MKASPSLSDSFRRLNRRERLVVAGGLAVSLIATGVTYGAIPWMRRWMTREAALTARRGELSRLETLVASEGALRRAVVDEQNADREAGALLSSGATPALAGAALQVLLRRYAQQSAVQLDRVDVAGQPTQDKPGLLAIPVTVQGQGDIYGLVAFLSRLQHGERLLVVDEIAVARALMQGGGDRLLAWSVRVHGLYPAPSAAQ